MQATDVNKKSCSKCKQDLPITDFVRRKFSPSGKWGYTSWCKPCRRQKAKQDWTDGGIRDKIYQRKFGITLEDYQRMFESQNGCCAICGTDKPTGHGKKNGRLSVDHDHETGFVRGLLCTNCNIALGGFFDNIDYLKKAIDYLTLNRKGN